MSAERWRRVERLYHSARERETGERVHFLQRACHGDATLQRDIESLLAKDACGDGFLDHPPAELLGACTAPLFTPGAQIGAYRIEELLGIGGSAKVYKALDPRLGRYVALKVLTPDTVNQGLRERFVREARAAAGLNHPNIAVIYEVGEAGETCFIAMEYVEGETLREKLQAPGTALSELLGYLRQTAHALVRAHAKGVVHCDLKPENIMVTREGQAKVLDFGVAKLIGRYKSENPASEFVSWPAGRMIPREPRTTGWVGGTWGYMSPEQAGGKKDLDERSDVFSFGCLLFEAATRQLPFLDESLARTFQNLLHEPVPRISELCPGGPRGLESIVDRCLEKDPATRYASMAEVERDLGNLLEAEGAPLPVRMVTPSDDTCVSKRTQRRDLILAALRKWAVPVAAALLAIISVAIPYFRWYPASKPPSIAVIPFVNALGTPQSEYLSDGISESLIHALAQLPDLKVIARSSSFRFKEQIDVRQVARTLGVQFLVSGRVAEGGGRLRITAELVSGADGSQVWGAQYNPTISDLAGVEAAIAREIAERIYSRLTRSEREKLAKGAKVNPEAYELLLRARYHMRLYTPESRRQAVSYYQQALALDPGFALASAELASAYRYLSGSAVARAAEMLPKAEASARRALAADADLAEAHAALADIKKDQWAWASAEREYRQALRLNPNLANAHVGFAIYLSVMGRDEEAIAEIQGARKLDPLGLPTAVHVAAVYYNARRYSQALDALKAAVDLDPAAPAPWTWIGIVSGGSGHFAKAVSAFETAIGWGDNTAATQCYYAYSLARTGRRDRAIEILHQLEHSDAFVPPSALAVIHLGLNEKERAIQTLQAAYAVKDSMLQYMKVESHLDSLHQDPRFQELAAKLGLPRKAGLKVSRPQGAPVSLKGLSRNYCFRLTPPLAHARGSESASEPRPLGSGWHTHFVTGLKSSKPLSNSNLVTSVVTCDDAGSTFAGLRSKRQEIPA
ncbi:MAG: protein kinase [Acidobacteria bacterium]|nr:protein kinase [Acidobacteriota bacterium]